MKVFVIGLNGIGLMPTTPRKARGLLKTGKARVLCKNPFTIELKYKTGSATQPLNLGIDTGEQHIGVAITNNNGNVEYKAEIQLRHSIEKRKLIRRRFEYRRNRRHRKIRYRRQKTKMIRRRVYSVAPNKNGKHWHTIKSDGRMFYGRPDGWLPPTIQSKVDHHIYWINKFLRALPKDTRLVIELARFDIQRMKDPNIHGELYQHGRMYSYDNKKAYVLAKYNYTCPICGHKFDKDHKPKMHHITYKSKGATDNPDEYMPVCEKCHTPENHMSSSALDNLRIECKRKEYREPAFMNVLSKRLCTIFCNAIFTYGNITNEDRKALGIEKTHANDAIAISLCEKNIQSLHNLDETVIYKQVRRKKRSLHEANPTKGRSKPNVTAKRHRKNVKEVKGFHTYDTVMFDGKRGYISGFAGTSAYVIDFNGNYLSQNDKSYKQIPLSKLKLVQVRTNNYIMEIW